MESDRKFTIHSVYITSLRNFEHMHVFVLLTEWALTLNINFVIKRSGINLVFYLLYFVCKFNFVHLCCPLNTHNIV
jgi:hypothetical protein